MQNRLQACAVRLSWLGNDGITGIPVMLPTFLPENVLSEINRKADRIVANYINESKKDRNEM